MNYKVTAESLLIFYGNLMKRLKISNKYAKLNEDHLAHIIKQYDYSKILMTKTAIQISPIRNSMFLELLKILKWYINKTLEKIFVFVFSKVQECSLTVSWKPNSFKVITTKLSQDF